MRVGRGLATSMTENRASRQGVVRAASKGWTNALFRASRAPCEFELAAYDAPATLPSGHLPEETRKLLDRVRLVQELETVGAVLRQNVAVAGGK